MTPPRRSHLLQHKGQQPREYGADGPHGVPGLGVEVAHAEAQARVGGEAAVGRDHANGWRLEGVLLGEDNLAVVVAARVRGALRALIPVEQRVSYHPQHRISQHPNASYRQTTPTTQERGATTEMLETRP